MDSIINKIELLMFYNLISDGSIITDEGSLNVEMKNNSNQRYSFIDDINLENRSDVDEKKILFLNQVMEILTELHSYLYENESEETPIYFDRVVLKNKIEDELSVNIEEAAEVEQTTESEQTRVNEQLEQITSEVTDMEL